MFLGIVRKVVKVSTKLVKDRQHKEEMEFKELSRFYCGAVNSFDFIAPVNKNI